MVAAEAQFRRVRGYRQFPLLLVAREEATADQPGTDTPRNVHDAHAILRQALGEAARDGLLADTCERLNDTETVYPATT